MAHSDEAKAKALALLMLGNTPCYVACETGVPLTTIRRWKPEALAMWDDILSPGVRTFLGRIGARLQQNGPRKQEG